MFAALAVICEDYFVPSLEVICDDAAGMDRRIDESLLVVAAVLHVDPDVAGATLMAAASSVPAIAASIIAIMVAKGEMGVSTALGSAVLNAAGVVSVSALFAGFVFRRRAGRRPVIFASVVASAACSLSAYLVESLLFFALCRFVLGSCLAVTFVTSSVLLFEIMGGEYRAAYVMLSQFGFSFGLLFVAVMDQLQLTWRAVQLCCSLPVFACAIAFLVVKGSPRWLVARGMFEEAVVVMVHAARVNGISRYRSMALWRNARNEIEKSHERWSTVIRAPFRGVLLSSNHFRFVLVMFVSSAARVERGVVPAAGSHLWLLLGRSIRPPECTLLALRSY
ncbi:beta-alanine transporter-like [Amblyomma americanum]